MTDPIECENHLKMEPENSPYHKKFTGKYSAVESALLYTQNKKN